MSERKVLNKYYPPDFDPSKIPRMKLPKNRQYTVRLMAPFNMRCATCGEYIYKGKKFNARKEDVENQDYLGIRIYRFYIKCTRCLQEISFKTDPRNTDYEIEAGATRNFMALKLAEEQAQREEDEAKEEEANNPMKLLENRTEQSKNEIELLESLEELKDLNRRQQTVDYDSMLVAYDSRISAREMEERMEQMDEEYIKTIKFQTGQKRKLVVEEEIVEIADDDKNEDSVDENALTKRDTTDILVSGSSVTPSMSSNATSSASSSVSSSRLKSTKLSTFSVGGLTKTKTLAGLVRVKKAEDASGKPAERPGEAKETPEVVVKAPNGLSLLGAYSGSDSNDSE